MSEFSANRVLGNFKIVKGMFLRGYSCQVFETNSSKIWQMELRLRAYLRPASYPYVWSYPSASVWSHISTESCFTSLGLTTSIVSADRCIMGDTAMTRHHLPLVCAACLPTLVAPHTQSRDVGKSEPVAEGGDAPLEHPHIMTLSTLFLADATKGPCSSSPSVFRVDSELI